MKVLFKIFNFKTMMFFLVLGISIFLYKYLVSTKPEAKPLTVEEKTFYVNYGDYIFRISLFFFIIIGLHFLATIVKIK